MAEGEGDERRGAGSLGGEAGAKGRRLPRVLLVFEAKSPLAENIGVE